MTTNMKKLNKNKVVLGLSGGVDSTAAALLLKEKGYEVTGYFFDVLGNDNRAAKEAKDAAAQLGIEFVYEDVSEEFSRVVIDAFCKEYSAGRTPNPCIICNPAIKFKKLLDTADMTGAYYIATGHYCRIAYDERKDRYFVRQGANLAKDQSYMLYRLGQEVLKRLVFPLGDFESKEEIRAIARGESLKNAEKKDSQEICFIDGDYPSYIKSRGFKQREGFFVNKAGEILGKHKGISNYTIGQRKGLGIALGKPAFVIKIDAEKNQVILGEDEDLFGTKVICENAVFTSDIPDEYKEKALTAKVRYSSKKEEVAIEVDDKKITAIFKNPQRAVTSGQSIVFYRGDIVVGGGFIK